MKSRRFFFSVLLAFLGALLFVSVNAMAAKPASGGLLKDVPVKGPVTSPLGTGMFEGKATITGFDAVPGADGRPVLMAKGVLSGTAFMSNGTTHTVANRAFSEPATLTQASGIRTTCEILELDIGAINLDLLGLVVDLSPIHLDITAQSGPGKLLGNLLCALVGLLDAGGPLSQILSLLAQINDLLS